MHIRTKVRMLLAAVLALTAVLTAGLLAAGAGPERPEEPDSPEAAVRAYLALMRDGRLDDLLDTVVKGSVGTDPGTVPARGGLPLAEAEARGLLWAVPAQDPVSARTAARALLSRQRAFILDQFGPQAWQEVQFTLEPVPGPADLQWVDAEGRTVAPEVAAAVLEQFWREIEAKEGVDLGVLDMLPSDWPGDEESFRAAFFAARRVQEQYLDKAPVRLEPVPRTQEYVAHLTFAGLTVSRDGFHEFRLRVVPAGKTWRVESLQWTPPLDAGRDI